VVSLLHLAAGFLLTPGIGRPSATRYKQSWSAVNRVYDSKAWRYAEDNTTESNCARDRVASLQRLFRYAI